MTGVVGELRDFMATAMLADLRGRAKKVPAGLGFDELLRVYLAWLARQVPARPRRVHLAQGLREALPGHPRREQVEALMVVIERGGDVTAHLSRWSAYAHEPSASRRRANHTRRDRDLLLADWGIHHLHLGPAPGQAGAAGRSGALLFAVFTTDDAYLLDVLPHGSWTAQSLADAFVRNWPECHLFAALSPGTALVHPVTDDERKELREAGITVPLEIDGRVQAPPGQTVQGVPIRVVACADAVHHRLRELQERLDADPGFLADACRADGGRVRDDARWSPVRDGDYFGLLDPDSDCFVRVVNLGWHTVASVV